MQNKIDLVYPLSSGSIWNNYEIRYSIRSFVQNFKELGNIYIIGTKPEFLRWGHPRLRYIYNTDEGGNKDRSIINRILEVCKKDDLSQQFIRASDDQLLLKFCQINDFRACYKEELRGDLRGNRWKRRLNNTYQLLKLSGKNRIFNYDSHYPMLYDKILFTQIISKFPFIDNGYTINTMYFNNILTNYEHIGSKKVSLSIPIQNLQDIQKLCERALFLGYNNKALRSGNLKLFIENLFPNKCEFEL
jgi:hypothetical protein